jgi:DNA-binding NtrC family response regulator
MEKLQTRKYDLALVDIKLPDKNGSDLVAKMHESHPKMIKIAITGFPSLEDATKVIDRGASAYLVKPVKPEELIRIITEKLKNQ